MKILVLGATGYVGGRLVPELLAAGHQVRCLARNPAKLAGRAWRDEVEIVGGDATSVDDLTEACRDMDVVYVLVHAMGAKGDFAHRELQMAAAIRDATARTHVDRVVYLGGLGDDDDTLSTHLASRHAFGRTLADGPVPVTELRAGVVIGSGSASFEMLRSLVEVLPAMVTPKWVDTKTQPIAVRDVLRYLVGVLDVEASRGRVLEIGGPEVLTYRQMLQGYAEVAGLRRRLIVPVPLLTPRLSSLWIGLVTPLPTALARPLIDSLVNEVVVRDPEIRSLIDFEPIEFAEAVRLALQRTHDHDVASTWSSAGGVNPASPHPADPDWAGGTVFCDVRSASSHASPEAVFAVVTAIGGRQGYFSAPLLWKVRGAIDKAVGGIGLRRGRRHPTQLEVGDAVDFWRVEALDAPRMLRLRAEMRLPGEAWLEFDVKPATDGGSVITQTARFQPRGLWGRAYWYGVAPFHRLVFPSMVGRLAAQADATVSG